MRSDRRSCATVGQPSAEPGGWSGPPRRGRGCLPVRSGRHSYRTVGLLPRTVWSAACRRGLRPAVPAACPTCRGRVVGAGWYPWGCGSWSRYRVRRSDRAIGQLQQPIGTGTRAWALARRARVPTQRPPLGERRPCKQTREEGIAISTSPLGRPGNDLLSRVLRRSTIGAGAFHGRVRNGIGCSHPAIITRSAKG